MNEEEMLMKRGILEDNANEAWFKAIVDCDDILSGKITLGYRKSFVSHLHNAIELFIKQHMLNINDHSVSSVKNGNDADGSPAREFYNSQDLNEFFLRLDDKDKGKFYSIEFNQLVEISKKLFDDYFQTEPMAKQVYTEGIQKIKNLRNDETHFYIDKENFLNEDDFKQLYNFMVVFYKILKKYKLLPYFGDAVGEFQGLGFERKSLTSLSYKKCIKSSQFLKEFRENLSVYVYFPWMGDSPFAVAQSICALHQSYRESRKFEELLTYVEGMLQYQILTIQIIEDDNNTDLMCEYVLKL